MAARFASPRGGGMTVAMPLHRLIEKKRALKSTTRAAAPFLLDPVGRAGAMTEDTAFRKKYRCGIYREITSQELP